MRVTSETGFALCPNTRLHAGLNNNKNRILLGPHARLLLVIVLYTPQKMVIKSNMTTRETGLKFESVSSLKLDRGAIKSVSHREGTYCTVNAIIL